MFSTLWAVVVRRRYLIAGVVAVAVGAVTLVAYLSPKTWEATTTIRLDPLQVAGLHSSGPEVPTRAEAVAGDITAANDARFRDPLLEGFDYPFTYTVDGDVAAGTISITTQADSAERSLYTSYSTANGYVGWGRARDAGARAAQLRAQIDTDGPQPELVTQLATAEAALEQVSDGGGEVVVEPSVPDNPSSPNLVARLLFAAAFGLAAGVVLAWFVDRRSVDRTAAANRPTRSSPPTLGEVPRRQRIARLALGTVAVVGPLLLVASAAAGVISVWELRPSTNAQDEASFLCFPRWLDQIPDGTVVAVTRSSPRFFYDHVQEFAFPRLTLATEGRPAELKIHIVAGRGNEYCGGYHVELVQP